RHRGPPRGHARRGGGRRARDGPARRCRAAVAGVRVVRHVLVRRRARREIHGHRAVVRVMKLGLSRTTTYDLPLVAIVLVLLLLGAVLIPGVGVSAGGATRWLRFGGSFGLQPAELAKLALIVYLATWLGGKRNEIGSWRITLPFILVTAAVVGLVVAEPDLGTAIVVVIVALAVYFAAGARLREFAALGGLTAVVVLALAVAQPYRLQRLVTFLDPWSDPQK